MVVVDEKTWLSRQEAAKRAGVHYNTIRQWEREGKLETRRIKMGEGGSEVQIDISSLDTVIGSRHTPVSVSESDARIAALEAENRELRQALGKSETERRELLERVLRLAERE